MSDIALFHAPLAVIIHVATVTPAAILGAYLLAARKGDRLHKTLGRIWLVLMVATSLTTFFIHEIRFVGDFSPIHLLSVFVIYSSFMALVTARRGNLRAHRAHVAGMYLGGIVGAGAFAFLPGRIMHESVFVFQNGLLDLASAALLAGLFAAGALLTARQTGLGRYLARPMRGARRETGKNSA